MFKLWVTLVVGSSPVAALESRSIGAFLLPVVPRPTLLLHFRQLPVEECSREPTLWHYCIVQCFRDPLPTAWSHQPPLRRWLHYCLPPLVMNIIVISNYCISLASSLLAKEMNPKLSAFPFHGFAVNGHSSLRLSCPRSHTSCDRRAHRRYSAWPNDQFSIFVVNGLRLSASASYQHGSSHRPRCSGLREWLLVVGKRCSSGVLWNVK